MLRKLSVFGMLAPVVYLIHVIVGGYLWKGYSHLHQPISDLTASGAPDRALLNNITLFNTVFSFIFVFTSYFYFRKYNNRLVNISVILMISVQFLSTSYALFPQDSSYTPSTFQGLMHYIVTGFIVPLIILFPLLAGLGFRKIRDFRKYSLYSIITSAVIFISGILTIIVIAKGLGYFGVYERINIGSYELWLFIIAFKMFRTDNTSIFAKS